MALNFSDAKKIPITEYLSSIGHEPTKIRGNNYWYFSPLRIETVPSFKVNSKLNLWYDHGSGEGGTLIDLGAKLQNCSVSEFVQKLSNEHPDLKTVSGGENKNSEAKLTIVAVENLHSQGLIDYLRGRQIYEDVAYRYCHEVSFGIGNKLYKAVGFKNNKGGFELRNHWFKGSSSPKDVSFIDNDSKKLCVFEGFMDFLSIEELKSRTPAFGQDVSHLILNSLSFLNKNIPILKSHEVFLFLDNDDAGRSAKEKLHHQNVAFADCSGFYSSFKDVNEYLVAQRSPLPEPCVKRSMKI